MPDPGNPELTQEQPKVDPESQAAATIDPNLNPESPRGTRQATEDRTYTVTVNGQPKQMNEQQVLEAAQRGLISDQQVSRLQGELKEADKHKRVSSALNDFFQSGDAEALRRVGAEVGLTGTQIEEMIEGAGLGDDWDEEGEWEDDEDDDRDEGRLSTQPPRKGQSGRPDERIGFSRFSPDVQRVLAEFESQRVGKIVDQVLDSDKELAYNLKGLSDEGRQTVRELVLREAAREAERNYGGDFGDGEPIKKVMPYVKKVVDSMRTRIPPMGLGPSPEGSEATVFPRKPPEPVSSRDAGYEEYLTKKIAYDMANAELSG